eukprot:CAMPEP_0203716544 /NCGR_PEP_ID=MMETSP0092-20131115/1170_1 /ASSEMBLY_ACC=CAM_ASM_001090 /TAXON_ID=426623 /ORGANISM="Chaetoceros affinis, Strain CCMP159" /LENGTH=51 /DNA_ID=CAMNT_0050595117 /DNA_START=193 /DNA_END=344 /DNA_ORIENTATION=+
MPTAKPNTRRGSLGDAPAPAPAEEEEDDDEDDPVEEDDAPSLGGNEARCLR